MRKLHVPSCHSTRKFSGFQLRSVLRFYKTYVRKVLDDLIDPTVWQTMLDEISNIEKLLAEDFKKINNTALRDELESLNRSATQSLQEIQKILHVAEKQLEINKEQLRVNQDQRDIAMKQTQYLEQMQRDKK